MLTLERIRELLNYDPDTGVFTWHWRPDRSPHDRMWNTRYAGKIAGRINSRGYRTICIDRRLHNAHRLAWLWVHGSWPANKIDHVNGDGADNRLANLREASHAENMRNSRKRRDNASGFKGVSWHKKELKWRATIMVSSKAMHIGYFTCPEEASSAYAAAAAKYHGKFARTS